MADITYCSNLQPSTLIIISYSYNISMNMYIICLDISTVCMYICIMCVCNKYNILFQQCVHRNKNKYLKFEVIYVSLCMHACMYISLDRICILLFFVTLTVCMSVTPVGIRYPRSHISVMQCLSDTDFTHPV